MKESWITWDSVPPKINVKLKAIDYFDARGMRRVYGRGDHFYCAFNMDIWTTRNGRVLMRCWSRYSEVDGRSYEIKGLNPSQIPIPVKGEELLDYWLPSKVRDAYDEWIQEEY